MRVPLAWRTEKNWYEDLESGDSGRYLTRVFTDRSPGTT